MINPNQIIDMTTTGYRPQFVFQPDRYYNAALHVATVYLEKMYIDSYNRRQIIKMRCDAIITER